MRKRQLRHTFLAHDAPVKSIVVDENEEFFISGSEDGDIKVTARLVITFCAVEVYTAEVVTFRYARTRKAS